MKKILLAVLIVFTMTNCSKDDDSSSGFSQAEKEALQVLNGTFVCDGTTIVFTPFDAPTSKKSTMNDVEIHFCGILHYKSHIYGDKYYENDYYFSIYPSTGEIYANAMIENKPDYFNAYIGKKWEYKIIDANTITLFDTDLSNPFFQTETYKRK